MSWIHTFADLTRSHLTEIAISITAMTLVIAGPFINKGAKALARPVPWLARYLLFVLLATVGFGVLTQVGVRAVQWSLQGLADGPLLGAVAGAHLALAWLLKWENHI